MTGDYQSHTPRRRAFSVMARRSATRKRRKRTKQSRRRANAIPGGTTWTMLTSRNFCYLAGSKTRTQARCAHLQKALAGKPRPWRASFGSAVCPALPSGETYQEEGECLGEIIPEECGRDGFGYDLIFFIEGQGHTMAELSMREKNQLSHRAQAVSKISRSSGNHFCRTGPRA